MFMILWRKIFGDRTAEVPPLPASNLALHPRLDTLVKASASRARNSADILNQQLDEILAENIQARKEQKENDPQSDT